MISAGFSSSGRLPESCRKQTHMTALWVLFAVKTGAPARRDAPYSAYGGLRVIKSAAHQRIIFGTLLNVHIKESSGHKVGHCCCCGCVNGLSEHHWECCSYNNAPNDALKALKNIREHPSSDLNINILVFERHKLNGPKALLANWTWITWMRLPNSTDPFSKPVVWYPWLPTNQSDNYLPRWKLFSTWEDRKPGWNAALRTWFLHLCSKPKLKYWGRFTACSFSSSSPWEASVSFGFLHICEGCSVSAVKCDQSGGWSLAMFIWCLCRNLTQKNSVWLRSLLFITFLLAI